jgi:hypothetical protein
VTAGSARPFDLTESGADRPPEPGAQVRILLGALFIALTCGYSRSGSFGRRAVVEHPGARHLASRLRRVLSFPRDEGATAMSPGNRSAFASAARGGGGPRKSPLRLASDPVPVVSAGPSRAPDPIADVGLASDALPRVAQPGRDEHQAAEPSTCSPGSRSSTGIRIRTPTAWRDTRRSRSGRQRWPPTSSRTCSRPPGRGLIAVVPLGGSELKDSGI